MNTNDIETDLFQQSEHTKVFHNRGLQKHYAMAGATLSNWFAILSLAKPILKGWT